MDFDCIYIAPLERWTQVKKIAAKSKPKIRHPRKELFTKVKKVYKLKKIGIDGKVAKSLKRRTHLKKISKLATNNLNNITKNLLSIHIFFFVCFLLLIYIIIYSDYIQLQYWNFWE